MDPTKAKEQFIQSKGADFTQPELVRIANRIPGKWEMIALTTGLFEDYEIVNIQRNLSYHDNVMKANAMLNDYKTRLGTRKGLVSALEEKGENDLAGKVQSKYYQTDKYDDTEVQDKVEELQNDMEKGLVVTDGASPNGNGQPEQAPMVFISYEWDIQEKVKKLREELESRNITCWMDITEMVGGDKWRGEIDEGIRRCQIVVSCVTEKYSQSDNCQKEVSLASDSKKPIIPVIFESLTWPLEGPMALSFAGLLYIKCEDGLTAENIEKLIEAIKSKTQ